MQVFHSFEEAQDYTATVVALGTFDGVHLGHQMVMKTAIDTARKMQAKAVVVTFAAHPLSVLCPERNRYVWLRCSRKSGIYENWGWMVSCFCP